MIALLIAAGVSLAFTLLTTPLWIRLFNRLGWGQFIRDDGPQSHHTKRGTPTMGGIVFILGTVVGYLTGHIINEVPWTMVAMLVIGMMVGLGLVGFVDDFLKTRKQRSLGLGGWSKIAGQVIVATVFGVLALNFPDENDLTPASTAISWVRDIPWLDLFTFGPIIGVVLFLLWVNLVTVSASNGVNVADGLDGLASGAAIFAISAYIFIGFWQANQSCFNVNIDPDNLYKCYEVRDPLDLAVVAAAITGSLVGFLWWNTSPAQLFMGDTGSLALGGALAALAILSRTELLLVLIGGLFIITTGSVILQRAYFKLTKWRFGAGRRIFLMSPLHHHFELKGWAEITVVVRFWLIAALFVAAGVGVFYLEWQIR
ncbi:phospho-N-acetylmuramoyl-pentapeptide-transferase [Protaetiibacter mangrovi]|uniref:Phospho-N-acetylmuramoyl-pentapeptide-transferase n=1 Tax=Protaetiibacter mangrovi TaxID=2970926 RepID=A0ABT1ZB75_9MICO|nr:phospho-N-acetylmuramoyl-pentapeptide-transferase [Protaetiibacter mangrovi]MCS0497949.1 phospho-N-acetylmuramoyl-pentapeptide-transferase [Protaetiibacter mangrovi]TPX02105.1 phospho-N-acetylmuramoyl-pentapeptide-transferase [Schumannella luteola]